MVERALSMREVAGSMPAGSIYLKRRVALGLSLPTCAPRASARSANLDRNVMRADTAPLVQLDRMSAHGADGRTLESWRG